MTIFDRYQLVWFGWTHWYFLFRRPANESSMAYVYSWFLRLGPLEIRRWRGRFSDTVVF